MYVDIKEMIFLEAKVCSLCHGNTIQGLKSEESKNLVDGATDQKDGHRRHEARIYSTVLHYSLSRDSLYMSSNDGEDRDDIEDFEVKFHFFLNGLSLVSRVGSSR